MTQETDRDEFEGSIRENIILAPLTTLQVGGPARFFAEVPSSDQMLAGIRWASRHGVPVFVLGGGSNIVVSDRGFPGLVLRNSISGLEMLDNSDQSTLLTAGAGESWDDVVKLAVANNLAGIECLSGIPGSVGATPIQNVGAYGQEVSETVVSLTALDTAEGTTLVIEAKDCGFGYRTSRFKTLDSGRFVITNVTYRLHRDGQPGIRYAELRRYLDRGGHQTASLHQVRNAVLAIRRAKAMVIDPGDPDSRSVGSFFVNPIVTSDKLADIEGRLITDSGAPSEMPVFSAPGGLVKLSAAWLIEQSGFTRGSEYGRVGLSSKHALAIVAHEGGTAREVMELASLIQATVSARFGIRLAPEPSFVGPE